MKKILILVTDAGGGHRASADALKHKLECSDLDYRIDIVNFYTDIFDYGWAEKIYNDYVCKHSLQKYYWKCVIPFYFFTYNLGEKLKTKTLHKWLKKKDYDLVISMMPIINKAVYKAVQRLESEIPFVTILTDYVNVVDHYWMGAKGGYIICPSSLSVQQAKNLGYKHDKIKQISSCLVHDKFSQRIPELDVSRERAALGLNQNMLTLVILSGAYGGNLLLQVANEIEKIADKVQCIYICGHDKNAKSALESSGFKQKKYVTGFTKDIPYFMQISDLCFGRPSPGVLTEAVISKLPVLSIMDENTLEHERANIDWLLMNNYGSMITNIKHLNSMLNNIIKNNILSNIRQSLQAVNMNPLQETIDFLHKIKF